jgi:hypothetical protein
VLPTGLVAGTLYYTVRLTATTSRLATSLANAVAETVIAYTDAGTGSHSVAVRNSRTAAQGTKYLTKLTAMTVTTTAVPLPLILCDYLLYYPFIDMSVTELQPTVAGQSLSRYTTGAGVQMMAVEVAAQIGGVSFNVTYTNSEGVAGRVSQTVTCNTQVSTGTIITTAANTAGCSGPFIPLQQGDSGVRSVQGITFLTGDVGLITIVLVKPLASLSIYDITAAAERDFVVDGLQAPVVADDAYLNFICMPSGTLASAQIMGLAEFVWN